MITRGWLLSTSLFLIAAGVLLQAMLAGLFISGTAGARLTHVIVGSVLPYLGIVPAVAAWRRARQEAVTRGFATSATLLLIALWVQEALGHMPFPITTVIHVPLGVLLFGLSLHLAIRARTSGS
jgi:cytochrome bd-type quinol oxidase subunit 1